MAGLMILGGAMQGYGNAALEQAKRDVIAQKQAAIEQLRFERERQMAAESRQFQAGENEKNRGLQQQEIDLRKQQLSRDGNIVNTPDGPMLQQGSQLVPITREGGKPITGGITKYGTETWRDLSGEEKASKGLDPKKAYQVDSSGQVKEIGGGGVSVNIGQEGDKFYENLDKKNAETFATLSEVGVQARSKVGQIDRLESLLKNAPQGGLGALKQMAGEFGIATEGLSDIQAATSLLEKLVPEQRQPGSGPMSDADIKMYRASLPRIINQPGGNQLIIQTLRGVANYEIQMGEIADKVADREITPAQARAQIRALENPLADFKVPDGGTPNEGWTEIAPGVRVRKID